MNPVAERLGEVGFGQYAPYEISTHPAGSVIALNGRNAAEAVLADAGVAIGAAA